MMRTLRSHSLLLSFCALTALGTSACLDRKQAVVLGSASNAATASAGFTGAVSAANLAADGLSIQINWVAAKAPYTSYSVFSVNQQTGAMTLLRSSLPITQTSYAQTGLSSGVMYSFIVQAFKDDGTSDGNHMTVSAFAYAGINKVNGITAASLNQATVNFPAAGPSAEGVKITCSNAAGTATATVSNYDTTATQQIITGLYSGTTYNCTVNALYNNYWGILTADNNTATYSIQTISISYTVQPPSPYTSAPNFMGAYQGVILVQAYGDAPTGPSPGTAPAAIPSPAVVPLQRQVSITWKNFTGVNPFTAQYRLVRVQQNGVLNMNTSAICTSSVTTACQVCISASGTNAISRTCTDNTVSLAKSPMRYEYAVSLIVNPSANPPLAEELPSTKSDAPFRVLVPIPPNNMVLVQRDSVNYDMCSYMGLLPDPQNYQRCLYNGLGAIPFNTGAFNATAQTTVYDHSGHANPGDHYDFGYNLFVDRWEAGCRWTPASNGGMCGAGATAGDCYSDLGPPLNSVGVNGNVFYANDGGGNWRCYYKAGGVWGRQAYDAQGITTPAMQAMYTNAPDQTNRVPSSGYIFQSAASNNCQAIIDPNYGPKRLFRQREFAAASPFQWMPGEPGQTSSAAIYTMANGSGNPASTMPCNAATYASVPFVATNNANELMPNGNFMIGSHYTANCVSRFGIQDIIGNQSELFSDAFTCSVGPNACISFATSPVDPGNKDLSWLEPFSFDGITGVGGPVIGAFAGTLTQLTSLQTTYLSVPMALPMATNDHGNAIPVTSFNAYDQLAYNNLLTAGAMPGISALLGSSRGLAGPIDRFSVLNSNRAYFGYRCVLPAE